MLRSLLILPLVAAVAAVPVAAQLADSACAFPAGARRFGQTYGDLHVCVAAVLDSNAPERRPKDWFVAARRSVLETRRPNDVRRMILDGVSITWTVNGQPRAVDSLADEWRLATLSVLDSAWEAVEVPVTALALNHAIDVMPAQRDSIRAEIIRVNKQEAEIGGRAAGVRANATALNAQVSAAEQRVRSLESQVDQEQNALMQIRGSSASDAQSRLSAAQAHISYLQDMKRQAEQDERSAEVRLNTLDPESTLWRIGNEERDLNATNRIALLNHRLAELDSARVAEIQEQIQSLDAANHLARLDAVVRERVGRLRAVLDSSIRP